MAFLSYRPITQNDRTFGFLMMAAGAALFTMAIASAETIREPVHYEDSWIIIAFDLFLFFGGMSWLVVNSRYSGRPWWKLLTWGGSWSGGVTGLSQLFLGTGTIIPVGLGMCAWTIAVALLVSKDSFKEFRDHEEEAQREEFIPEHAIGTPRNPTWNARQPESADGTTSSQSDGRTEGLDSKV